MRNLISSIRGNIPCSEKDIVIDAEGKNIIITGMNGCGKTLMLKALFSTVRSSLSKKDMQHEKNLLRNIRMHEQLLTNNNTGQTKEQIYQLTAQLDEQKKRLNELKSKQSLDVDWVKREDIIELALEDKIVISFFEATRQYSQVKDQGGSLSQLKTRARSQQISQDFSTSFESYLVAFFEAGYIAWAMRNDEEEKQRVDAWISSIEDDLKHLFEDETLSLKYNEVEKTFYIEQEGKQPYTFNTLSSGYSSILKVYADLLMKIEVNDLNPKDLKGVVIIDEIDAHLHVSLQRKIFSFLSEAYPNIQFIVSTHSPFVLQSVDDAVIYDLSTLEQLEDLSMYSYDSIAKGLLGVDTRSQELGELVSELGSLINSVEHNRIRVNEIIEKLSEVENELDSKSRVVLLMAREAITDSEGNDIVQRHS